MTEKNKILEVKNLKQYFKVGRSTVKAVDDVSFDIYEGETFGLVGESGSGKTTTGRSILHLYEPTSGEIIFKGKDINKLKGRKEKMQFRRDAQMIFQDPYASLNPRMTVEDIIAEGLAIHQEVKNKADRKKRVYELLDLVGLNKEHASRFPHEFSGGQRFISDRIGVMRFGKLLEVGTADEVYNRPLHDYTKSLISAVPIPDPDIERQRQRIKYDDSKVESRKDRSLHEIEPGHFVRCADDEVDYYLKVAKSYV